MSTRCLIAKQVAPGRYRTIYCHSDGYPDGVGRILLSHYTHETKIDQLLDLGDISVLDKYIDPDPNKVHGFGYSKIGDRYLANRQDGVTLAYCRDRGDFGTGARVYSLKELDMAHVDYVYIFKNGTWRYFERLADGVHLLEMNHRLQGTDDGLTPVVNTCLQKGEVG